MLFEERVFHVFGVLTFQNEKLGLAFRVYIVTLVGLYSSFSFVFFLFFFLGSS